MHALPIETKVNSEIAERKKHKIDSNQRKRFIFYLKTIQLYTVKNSPELH